MKSTKQNYLVLFLQWRNRLRPSHLGITLLFLIGSLLVACGGGGGVGGTGGGGGSDGGGGGGGVGGTGIVSMGTVKKTEPATITVNNTAYAITAKTKVTVDGQSAPVTDLQPGMVVEVDAYKYTDTQITEAETITYKNSLTGPISSISSNCSSMVILGQTIETDTHTLPTLVNGLCDYSIGQIVEVSGYVSDTVLNAIRATFIRLKAASQQVNLSGVISSVEVAQKTFVIGALTIEYANAVFEPSNAVPQTGSFARVDGIATGLDTVAATKIEIKPQGLAGTAGKEVEVTGFVSDLSGTTFTVNGQAINASRAKISPATASLANGVKVEVDGKFDAQSVIDAIEIEIEIKSTSPISIQSNVEAISANGLTLSGIAILVNDSTQFQNESTNSSKLKLSDIRPNDQVTISCYRDTNGNLVARKVELKNPSTKFAIEGDTVSVQPSSYSFSILEGLDIVVVIGNLTEIKSENGHSLSAEEFLARLHSGSRVKAEGVLGSAKLLDATSGKVEIKD